MPPEFRFECKYCNKPINAPYTAMGRKIGCPYCKNPVSIPIVDIPAGLDIHALDKPKTVAMQKIASDRQRSGTTQQLPTQKRRTEVMQQMPAQKRAEEEMQQMPAPKRRTEVMQQMPVQRPPTASMPKMPERRPIHVRYQWEWLTDLLKLAIFAAIIYGGYQGYLYYQKQSQKDLPTLIQEYNDGRVVNDILIKQRITENNLETLAEFSRSGGMDTRQLMAECLGQLKTAKVFEPLARMLSKDKDPPVREAAATALKNVKTKKCVEFLIKQLNVELNELVRGAIGFSLREMTGENPTTGKHDFWKIWWEKEGPKFKMQQE